MRLHLVLIVLACLQTCHNSYIPELILTTTSQFFNHQLAVYLGPIISNLTNNFSIPDVHYDDKFDGVNIKLNLTQIKQKVQANWYANVLNVTGMYDFGLLAKNINVTLNARIEFKIGLTRMQKGQLQISITALQADSYHSFVRLNCSKSLGFGLNVRDILVDSDKLQIQIKGKRIDNEIINLLKYLLKSRIPNLINTKMRPEINSLLQRTSCSGPIIQTANIGRQKYIISLNTSSIPFFSNKSILTIPIDLNIQNEITNQTNQEVDNQNLCEEHVYDGKANCTVSMSSNMVDTLVWLVDDSKLLSQIITKDQLGPNPPITLDTNGLAILLPGLRKYPNKDVLIRINTSSQFSQVFIRSGRVLSQLSIGVDFIINDTSKVSNATLCLMKQQCFIASSLNLTIGLSLSFLSNHTNTWFGLIQSLSILDIKIISSVIDINLNNLKTIINTLILSIRPQINKSLQEGVVFSPSGIQTLKKFNVTQIMGMLGGDYASLGLVLDG